MLLVYYIMIRYRQTNALIYLFCRYMSAEIIKMLIYFLSYTHYYIFYMPSIIDFFTGTLLNDYRKICRYF